ncbi:MAG TPA: hypothetical protein VMY38_01310 [Gemmatimonadaceae bacterium]|nr:hypothetical protein [Gemmatimonadaceae bacterium]
MRRILVGLLVGASFAAGAAEAQRFDPRVRQPAHPAGAGARVLIDAGHHNGSRAALTPLTELLTADGYRVSYHQSAWTAAALGQADVVIIASPLGASRESIMAGGADNAWSDLARRDAFTAEEVVAITRWVRGGGNLLLVLDEAPVPAAARSLAEALGVEVRNTRTWDAGQRPAGYTYPDDDLRGSWVMFSREKRTVGRHPILDGRNKDERVESVASYMGSSLVGPFDGTVLLALSPNAFDYWKDAPERGAGEHRVPAIGRARGVAFKLDQGRVVVVSEADMFQVPEGGAEDPGGTLGKGLAFGGAHNKQFALNTLRWLSRVLP